MKRIQKQNKKRKDLEELKNQIERQDSEIKKRDTIIKSLEDKEESYTEESDDEEDESDAEEDVSDNDNTENQTLLLGSGYFGKEFVVREGMEEEANSLRNEWRHKQKQQNQAIPRVFG